MSRKLTRTLVGVALFGAVAACTVSLSFSHTEVQEVVFTGAAVNQAVPVDLSTQSEVQAHKDSVQSITLDYLDATVTAIGSSNNVTVINGTMKLRPDGGATDGSQDVLVGSLTNVPIVLNENVHLTGTPALDALVLSTVRGSGKATVFVTGTATGPSSGTTTGDFTLTLAFHISMDYSP
jgi:hypothetical protein